jgi:hypothetical protein
MTTLNVVGVDLQEEACRRGFLQTGGDCRHAARDLPLERPKHPPPAASSIDPVMPIPKLGPFLGRPVLILDDEAMKLGRAE